MSQPSVQNVAVSEEALIEKARKAMNQCNWVVGECVTKWITKYARGRTDADFGQLVGLSGDQVYQRRRVWETFGSSELIRNSESIRWTHFYVALNWEDATECLNWAEEQEATVAEMRAWRRAKNGDDLFGQPEESYSEWASPLVMDAPSPAANLTADDVPDTQPETVAKPRTTRESKSSRSPVSGSRNTAGARGGNPTPAEPDKAETGVATVQPVEDADTRVMFALREIAQVVAEVTEKKKLAAKIRKLADEIDPPAQASRFRPPTAADVQVYNEERGANIDAEKFVDFYTSKDWKVGKTKMKDWKAAFRNAERDGWCDLATSTTRQKTAVEQHNDDVFDEVFGDLEDDHGSL